MTIAELEDEFDRTTKQYQAEECQAFCALLEKDIQLLNRIQELEQAWSEELHVGRVKFSFEFDRNITQRYQGWVNQAQIRLHQLELQEERGCHSEAADEFRNRLEQAREVLGERQRDERMARQRAELIAENGDR